MIHKETQIAIAEVQEHAANPQLASAEGLSADSITHQLCREHGEQVSAEGAEQGPEHGEGITVFLRLLLEHIPAQESQLLPLRASLVSSERQSFHESAAFIPGYLIRSQHLSVIALGGKLQQEVVGCNNI